MIKKQNIRNNYIMKKEERIIVCLIILLSISFLTMANIRMKEYSYTPVLEARKRVKLLPINQKTRGENSSYIRIGSLHEVSPLETSKPVILPVYGSRTFPRSQKWQYYTFTDQYNKVKLPIYNEKQKNCQNEYGCDELESGDDISINAYSKNFTFQKYLVDAPKYIPYI